MRKIVTVIVVGICLNGLYAQDLSGKWQGLLFQENTTDTFYYEIQLAQDGDQVSGTSFSKTMNGEASAQFSLTGIIDSASIVLQEIRQLTPETPKWCLKYMILRLTTEDGKLVLKGDWRAKGCIPGKVVLTNTDVVANSFVEKRTEIEELPFTIDGKWTGYLSQSDRDYGFYFEINLEEGEAGESYIVSEDNGGSAFHHLSWKYDPKEKFLALNESEVKRKTDERWPWCIKRAGLQLSKREHNYVLEGEWSGYIEGYSPQTGACAPGSVYLEKPISTRKVVKEIAKNESVYQLKKSRKVNIQRIIEVQSPNLKIRVWDNGTVDGDIVTVFLNGELLFENYRVTKHKYTKLVTLKEEDNFLILHAEDLGDISPNTVAVSIDDGAKEHVIILSSNLDESGAVLVKQFKLE